MASLRKTALLAGGVILALGAVVAVRTGTVFVDDGAAVRSVGTAPTGTLVESTPGGGPGSLDRPLVVGDDGAVAAFDGRDFVDTGVAAVVPPGATTAGCDENAITGRSGCPGRGQPTGL